jgi:hypothetical protein
MEETLLRVLGIIEAILSHLLNSDDRMSADHPAVQQCAELRAAIAPAKDAPKDPKDKPHMGESEKDGSKEAAAAKPDAGKQRSDTAKN